MMKYTIRLSIIFFLTVFFSCSKEKMPQKEETLKQSALTQKRPNILWLVTEDMGHYIPPFGDSSIVTPNLSRLAAEGVRYTHLFSPSGVCAPSRAAIATGMYPSSIGANHMRTNSHTDVTGLPSYEAVPPTDVKMFSELLREKGYYCSNNSKQDYQFKAPITAWNESSNFAHWRNRKKGQPFFSIFNFNITHESGLFEPYGFRKNELRLYQAGDTTFKMVSWQDKTEEAQTTEHISKEVTFPVPPYLPNNEVVQREMWKMYNNIVEMDRQVGAILAQLEADGLLDETIIFFYADHGGPLPRQKRLIYDSGLKAPLIVRFPDKKNAGSVDDQLVSFIDFAPTVLSLSGQALPTYLQGQSFIEHKEKRKYIHAAADRFDGFTDAIRAVRDKRFKYIRNYRPEQGYYLPVTYRERIPTMQELLRLRDAGQLSEIQAQWFRNSKPKEELFDCLNDPHELINLATNPDYTEKLKELSNEMDRWLSEINDIPNLPEEALISKLWEGQVEQPITEKPIVNFENSLVTIDCKTQGASIGYRIIKDEIPTSKSWEVYTKPFELLIGTKLEVQAHRIGYKASEVLRVDINTK